MVVAFGGVMRDGEDVVMNVHSDITHSCIAGYSLRQKRGAGDKDQP